MGSDKDNYWGRLAQRKLSRRRVLQGAALGSAGLAAAAVIGCGDDEEGQSTPTASGSGSPSEEQPQRGGTLNLVTFDTSDFPHVDPHAQSFLALHDTGPAIAYGRPMQLDQTKYPGAIAFSGDITQSYETPDPQTYVFKIRSGVKFQNIPPVNGRAVNADDIVYSLNRQRADGTNVNGAIISAIDTVSATGTDTVTIKLKRADADFVWAMAEVRTKIVAKEAVDVNGDLKNGPTIGTGPWMFQEWVPVQRITMKRNPDYWKQGQPYFDGWERVIVADRQTEQAAFRTGQSLLIGTNGQITQLLKQGVPNLEVQDAKLLQLQSWIPLMTSAQNGPTKDIRVRQAISKLIDRRAIIDAVLFGSAYINASIFVPSTDWFLSESETNQLLGRDVQAAKQLLQAAAVDTNSWKPVLDAGLPGSDQQASAELLVGQFREINVVPTIHIIDRVEITDRVFGRGDFEINLSSHRPGGGGPNGQLYTWFHSTGTDATIFKQAGGPLDQLIDQQAVILNDPERRKSLLQEIMRKNIEQAMMIPLYVPNGEWAVSPKIKGFKQSPGFPERFDTAWLKG